VSIRELVREVLESLQQIAGPARNGVVLHLAGADQTIGLNQAIALSLYLAVVVPPYLDFAASVGRTFDLSLRLERARVDLVLRGNWEAPVTFDSLRNRLAKAYERQLNAESLPAEHPVEIGLRFPLISPRQVSPGIQRRF
jgi:hypothetical protein